MDNFLTYLIGKKKYAFLPLLILSQFLFAQKQKTSSNKNAIISSVEKHQDDLINLSRQIWTFAEIAMQEKQSSKVLADFAEAKGFKITRAAANIPTAFIAEFGTGRPIIGILGEFDALPGSSQKAQPTKEPLNEGGSGHACGHNLFGAGSLGAAIAIKELIAAGKLTGTIRFYGTPAEEDIGGKVYMARAGLFDDLDVCLDWHPDDEIKANMQSSQAIIDYDISFTGKSAHAATDPWNGSSALDAAELFNIGVNFLREHINPSARIHYVYKDAGNIPNVIPDKATVWIWMRDSRRSGVKNLEDRIRKIADGAALMAGVNVEIKLNTGCYELLINETGARLLQKNIDWLGGITYTKEEMDFAEKIMKEYGAKPKGINGKVKPLQQTREEPEGGSTDVGDVSYIVPEITLYTTTAPFEAPDHSWVIVACSGMSIGEKGMLYSAKALGITMVDLFENEQLRKDIRSEFEKRRGTEKWKALLPE